MCARVCMPVSVWTGLWLHSRCCASERCLNVCGSVYGSAAGESASGLPVECVGVFVVFEMVLCFLTFNMATVSMRTQHHKDNRDEQQ